MLNIKNEKGKMIFIFSMFVILACVYSLVQMFLLRDVVSQSVRDNRIEEAYGVNDNWVRYMDDGSIVPFDQFNERLDSKVVKISRIFIYDEEGRNSLLFENDYCAIEVYQDDWPIFNYGSQDDIDNGILLGNCYCSVPVQIGFGQATEISIVFRSEENVTIHDFQFGTEESVVSKRFTDYVPTLLCIIGAFIAIILLLVMIYFGKENHVVNESYFHFLSFLCLISIWGLSDTQILEGLGLPAGIVCIASFESFMLFMIPFFLFLYSSFESMKRCDILMASLFAANFIVLNVLQFTGVCSFVKSTNITVALIIISLAFILVQIVIEFRLHRSNMTASLLIGFSVLILASVLQLIIFFNTRQRRNAGFLQVGLIIFIVIQILNIVRDLFKKVDEGFQAETYLQLAKTDSLTGLGNRRGLDLLIGNIGKTHPGTVRIGCVVCDLNDLKRTNDSFGHNAGDKLITDFAGCLSRCYQDVGIPFRTGGDEFYVLFCNIEVDMNAMLRRLELELERCNFTRAIHVSCSYGAYAGYVDSSDQKAIWDIIKKADEEMYLVKKVDRANRLIEK